MADLANDQTINKDSATAKAAAPEPLINRIQTVTSAQHKGDASGAGGTDAAHSKDTGGINFLAVVKDQSPTQGKAASARESAHDSRASQHPTLPHLDIIGLSADLHKKLTDVTGKGNTTNLEKIKEAAGKALNDPAGEKRVSDLISQATKQAYSSPTAAALVVANKLADDPHMRKMVTDAAGHITASTLNDAMRLAAGQAELAARTGRPQPRDFDSNEMSNLNLLRNHFQAAAAVINEALNGKHQLSPTGQTTEVGIDAANVAAAGSKAIAKMMASNPSDTTGTTAGTNSDNFHISDALIKGIVKDLQHPHDKAGEATPEHRESTPRVSDAEFVAAAKRVIEKLDTAHTGSITKDQIAKAMEDPQFKGQDAQALAAMYHNFGALHNTTGHDGLLSTGTINAADMDKYGEAAKNQDSRITDAFNLNNWANINFGKYDADKSGALTRDEIASAINNPATPANDKKMLQVLQNHYDEMSSHFHRGVTLDDFQKFTTSIYDDTADAKTIGGVYYATSKTSQGQSSEISHRLYSDQQNPLNSINADAIHQGSIGDCYFEASLASVAQSHPEMIKNSIKDNQDGTYTVTFPGAKTEPITVKAPTEAEQGLYNHGSSNGLWASVMEKAYGQYCEQSVMRRGLFNIGGGNNPTEGADGGGTESGVIKLLTGSDASSDTLIFTRQSTVANNLEHAFASHPPKAVTAGINKGFSETTSDKFYHSHAYSITGFVPDGKGGGMVTIRNPWGRGAGVDGTITVSLDKLMNNFSEVTIEQ